MMTKWLKMREGGPVAVCLAGLLALLAAVALPSAAAPIIMQVVSVDSARGGNIQLMADGVTETGYAGAINIRLDGVPYEAFCVDLFTNIGLETISVNPFAPYGTPNANGARVAWLYATQFPSVNSVTAGEGLQLAIWDIIHDGGDGLGSGRVRASTGIGTPQAVLTAANQYIGMSLGQSSGAASIYVSVDGPAAKQALISVYLGSGSAWPTPEPETSMLTGIGLASAALYGRRRRRDRSVSARSPAP